MNNHKLLTSILTVPWSASATTIGGQALDSRDKSECDSAVCSSLHETHYTGLPFGLVRFFLT